MQFVRTFSQRGEIEDTPAPFVPDNTVVTNSFVGPTCMIHRNSATNPTSFKICEVELSTFVGAHRVPCPWVTERFECFLARDGRVVIKEVVCSIGCFVFTIEVNPI